MFYSWVELSWHCLCVVSCPTSSTTWLWPALNSDVQFHQYAMSRLRTLMTEGSGLTWMSTMAEAFVCRWRPSATWCDWSTRALCHHPVSTVKQRMSNLCGMLHGTWCSTCPWSCQLDSLVICSSNILRTPDVTEWKNWKLWSCLCLLSQSRQLGVSNGDKWTYEMNYSMPSTCLVCY